MAPERPGKDGLITVDSRSAPVGDRLEYWRQFLTNRDSVELVTTEKDFIGRMRRLTLGDCTLFQLDIETPHRVIRSKRPGLCVANIHLKVDSGTYRGRREFALTSGDLTIHDASAEYEFDYRSGAAIVAMVVPRARLEPYVSNLPALFDQKLASNKLLVRSLSDLCRRMVATDHALSPAVNDNLAAGISGLLGAALQDAGERLPHALTWSQKALLQRIKNFIREHLGQADLSPRIVAKAMGISVGYVHRLYQLDDSSVMRFILAERLDRARMRLRRPRGDESIGQIAFACGFSDASHFARAFREKFGVSPREYRREAEPRG